MTALQPLQPLALVVDDDPPIRALVRRMLQSLGYQVIEAANGRSALEQIAAQRPGIVCLDLVLPEASGYEVLEQLRQTPGAEETPVLVMSARTLPEDRASAEELGVRAYLTKPFSLREFRAGVAKALGLPRPGRRPP